MIVEQTIEASEPIVMFCFHLYDLCRDRITANFQKFYVYHPTANPWLSEDHHELLLNNCLDAFVDKARKILVSEGFNIDCANTDINVELHCAYASIQFSDSVFKIHQDNNNDTTVCTLIIYFDVSCYAGELVFYNSSNDTDIMQKINVNNPSRNECKLVMFDGHHWHKPLPFNNGNRNLLVFHFPATAQSPNQHDSNHLQRRWSHRQLHAHQS